MRYQRWLATWATNDRSAGLSLRTWHGSPPVKHARCAAPPSRRRLFLAREPVLSYNAAHQTTVLASRSVSPQFLSG